MNSRIDTVSGREFLILGAGGMHLLFALVYSLAYFFPQMASSIVATEGTDWYKNLIMTGAYTFGTGMIVFVGVHGFIYRRNWFYWMQGIGNIPVILVFFVALVNVVIRTFFPESEYSCAPYPLVFVIAAFAMAGVVNIAFYFLDKNLRRSKTA